MTRVDLLNLQYSNELASRHFVTGNKEGLSKELEITNKILRRLVDEQIKNDFMELK